MGHGRDFDREAPLEWESVFMTVITPSMCVRVRVCVRMLLVVHQSGWHMLKLNNQLVQSWPAVFCLCCSGRCSLSLFAEEGNEKEEEEERDEIENGTWEESGIRYKCICQQRSSDRQKANIYCAVRWTSLQEACLMKEEGCLEEGAPGQLATDSSLCTNSLLLCWWFKCERRCMFVC